MGLVESLPFTAINNQVKIIDQDHKRLLERPVESDTIILVAKFIRTDGIPILLERWTWDGVEGSSAVFLNQHVAGMTDADLKKFLTERAGLDLRGGVTITRGDAFVFVNFAFLAAVAASGAVTVAGDGRFHPDAGEAFLRLCARLWGHPTAVPRPPNIQ